MRIVGFGSDSRYSRTARAFNSSGYFFGAATRDSFPVLSDHAQSPPRKRGNLTKRELSVRHTLARIDGQHVLTTPKTKRSRRRVPLSDELARELKALRTRQKEERLRAGDQWKKHDEMVFTTEIGDYFTPQNLFPVVKAAAKRAGLGDNIGPHTLRHSAAVAWLEAGVHIKAVADLLGHSSISITGDIYGHTTPTQARTAVDALERAMGVIEGRTDDKSDTKNTA
ncbi:site-specific integrase [Nocardia cyriacigeorgica]|uniref:site-specific integrase n=1 Tax=Nocardia cyriacigeorgica TaxID=135487 RepID=UPI003EE2A580